MRNQTYNYPVKQIQGKIVSSWKVNKNALSINVEIPANTSANVVLPVNPKLSYTITESGKSIIKTGLVLNESKDSYQSQIEGNKVKFALGSGTYNFNIVYTEK